MRRKLILLICISAALFLIFTSGCRDKFKKNGQPDAAANQTTQSQTGEKKLIVYASIYPMYDFAKKIGRDKIDLVQMIPQGAEPHAFEPSAKLMAEMEKADVFIFNGAGIEPWALKLIKSIESSKLIVVDASKGIELLKLEHHHDEDDKYGQYDPHIWLDPVYAAKQAESIKNALIECDSANKEFYEINYKDFTERLTALNKKYKEELSNLKRKEIVVAHAAFGYLANRYGLEQIAIKGITTEEEPSPAKMAQITEIIKNREVKYVFFESLTSPKLSEVLAKEAGAKTAVLNPIDGFTEADSKAGKDYLSVMEENLVQLKKALGE